MSGAPTSVMNSENNPLPDSGAEQSQQELNISNLLNAETDRQIEAARAAGNETQVAELEALKAIDDKDVYFDTQTGGRVTVLDGDSETIKPYLAASHKQQIESAGGVEALIAQRTEMYQAGVDAGRTPQVVADKYIEILKAAGDDPQKYAELRFENNAFFDENRSESGMDGIADANDIILIRVSATAVSSDTTAAPTPPEVNLDDDRTFVTMAENGQLTSAGQMLLIDDMMSTMGSSNFVDPLKDNFDSLMQEHGSVEAVATHLESNIEDMFGGDENSVEMDPEQRNQILQAVRESEGNAAVFAAQILNDISDNLPAQSLDQSSSPQTNPNGDTLENDAKRATDLQNLTNGGLGALGQNEGMLAIMGFLVAIFTGRDPQEVIAEMKASTADNEGADNKTVESTLGVDGQQTQDAPNASTDSTSPSGATADQSSTSGTDSDADADDQTPPRLSDAARAAAILRAQQEAEDTRFLQELAETPHHVTSTGQERWFSDAVEQRGDEIAQASLAQSSGYQALVAEQQEIVSELDDSLKRNEITPEQYNALVKERTQDVDDRIMATQRQVKQEAYIAADKELNPEAYAAKPNPTNSNNGSENQPDSPEQSSNEGTDASPERTPAAEGTVENALGADGAVTYQVDTVTEGEPVADFDNNSMSFKSGANAPELFNTVVSPDSANVQLVNAFGVGVDTPSDPLSGINNDRSAAFTA